MEAVGTYSEPWSSKKLLNNKRDFQIFWRRGWDSNPLFKPHTHRGRPVFSESRYGACNLPRQSAFALIQATMNLLLSFRIIGYINNINCMVTSPVALLSRLASPAKAAPENPMAPLNTYGLPSRSMSALRRRKNQKLIRMAVVITHQRELGSSYDGCKLLVTHVH